MRAKHLAALGVALCVHSLTLRLSQRPAVSVLGCAASDCGRRCSCAVCQLESPRCGCWWLRVCARRGSVFVFLEWGVADIATIRFTDIRGYVEQCKGEDTLDRKLI